MKQKKEFDSFNIFAVSLLVVLLAYGITINRKTPTRSSLVRHVDSEGDPFAKTGQRQVLVKSPFHQAVSKNNVLQEAKKETQLVDFIVNGMLGPIDKLSLAEVEGFVASHGGLPKKTLDRNNHTGSMKLLSSKKPFAGLDQFMAQFFLQEDRYTPQHISFVIGAHDKRSKRALIQIGKELSSDKKFAQQSGQSKVWHLSNGYVFWMRELTNEDVHNDDSLTNKKIIAGSLQVGLDVDIH